MKQFFQILFALYFVMNVSAQMQTDVSDLANGVYLVNFDFNGTQIVKRIVIQK